MIPNLFLLKRLFSKNKTIFPQTRGEGDSFGLIKAYYIYWAFYFQSNAANDMTGGGHDIKDFLLFLKVTCPGNTKGPNVFEQERLFSQIILHKIQE